MIDGYRQKTTDDVKGNGYVKIIAIATRIEKNLVVMRLGLFPEEPNG